ncbi:MAG TPA: hypothetical protein VEK11_14005, partial [Thermoanaerobaculia bacterium]|nr:hypothetical protein [Thermoanaerobaculia bacterium]
EPGSNSPVLSVEFEALTSVKRLMLIRILLICLFLLSRALLSLAAALHASKESRLPLLLSYSVVKEPTSFDRLGSMLSAIASFRPHHPSGSYR